jgi:hypothetical protein
MLTTAQVAARLSCHRSTVVRAAAAIPVVGQRVGSQFAFVEADLAVLRDRIRERSGNPNWQAGCPAHRRQAKKAARTRLSKAGKKK